MTIEPQLRNAGLGYWMGHLHECRVTDDRKKVDRKTEEARESRREPRGSSW